MRVNDSFRWMPPWFMSVLKELESSYGGRVVKIVAQHADIKNRNSRVYTADEMRKAARTMSFRPLDINHSKQLPHGVVADISGLTIPQNTAILSEFEDGRLETVAWVDDNVAKAINAGQLNKASPSGIYLDHSKNTQSTEIPAGLYFDGLALLDNDTPPGDPLTQVIMDDATGSIQFMDFTVKESQDSVTEMPDSLTRAGEEKMNEQTSTPKVQKTNDARYQNPNLGGNVETQPKEVAGWNTKEPDGGTTEGHAHDDGGYSYPQKSSPSNVATDGSQNSPALPNPNGDQLIAGPAQSLYPANQTLQQILKASAWDKAMEVLENTYGNMPDTIVLQQIKKFQKGQLAPQVQGDSTEEAEWTAATMNDLPDSSFAYISPGGKKDADGKTTPRSLRHLPYKGADGSVDLPHLRNALARLNQTDIPAAAKSAAQSKLSAAAKGAGVGKSNESKGRENMGEETEKSVEQSSPANVPDSAQQVFDTSQIITKVDELIAKRLADFKPQKPTVNMNDFLAKVDEIITKRMAGFNPLGAPNADKAKVSAPQSLTEKSDKMESFAHGAGDADFYVKMAEHLTAQYGEPTSGHLFWRIPILNLPSGYDARKTWLKDYKAQIGKIREALATTTSGSAMGVSIRPPIIVEPPAALVANLRDVCQVGMVPQGSDRVRFQRITTAAWGTLTENTEPTEVTQTLTTIDITPALQGAQQSVSFESSESILGDLVAAVTESFRLGELVFEDAQVATAWDAATPAATLFGDESVGVETSITSSMTFAGKRLASAVDQITRKGYTVDDLVAIVSPKQYGDLLKDIGATNALTFWPQAAIEGVVPDVYGVEVRRSGKVVTGTGTTAGVTTYHAGVFKKNRTMGLGMSRDLLLESFRDIKANKTIVKGSARIQAATLEPNSLVKIITA